MVTFICYDKCSTCKKARAWLKEKGVSYEERPIKENNPTYEELRRWTEKSGQGIRKFFNTSGTLYKTMNLKDRLPEMSDEEQLRLLSTDGMLVKRPIIINGDKVCAGFKEETWEKII